MNISKIIFKVNNKSYEINKSFYYKYETKYFGKKIIISQKRFKRFYSQWETNLKDGLKPDYMTNKTIYRLLNKKDDYSYKCFNHKNELIKKDSNFYKYIKNKNLKFNS